MTTKAIDISPVQVMKPFFRLPIPKYYRNECVFHLAERFFLRKKHDNPFLVAHLWQHHIVLCKNLYLLTLH